MHYNKLSHSFKGLAFVSLYTAISTLLFWLSHFEFYVDVTVHGVKDRVTLLASVVLSNALPLAF